MKKISFVLCFLLLFTISAKAQEKPSSKSSFMIRHTVAFNLKFPKGSTEENEFLKASKILATLPSVHNFGTFRETSKKNEFDYFFYMEFESMEGYEEYNNHPDHVEFVNTYWVNYVDKFIEIDYEPIE